MADDKSYSIVSLGKLSKPADTLIKKVSLAVGGIFEPWQITRLAKANAKADLIGAESEIEVSDLHRRAMHRFVEEEAQRQENMESITKKALPDLSKNSDPSKIETDWVTNFFDKSRIISDDEMQNIWAKVLAGEANAPGTYSKRTVNFLGDLDKSDAELFQKICNFGWFVIDEFVLLIFNIGASIYNENGIDFDTLSHLDNIGLIKLDHHSAFLIRELPKKFTATYHDKHLGLAMAEEENNDINVGHVLLTQVGVELISVCKPAQIEGFHQYVSEQWKEFLPRQKK